MTNDSHELAAPTAGEASAIPTSPVSPAVQAARGLLMAITTTSDDVFTRLSASSALGRLTDLSPPYPPSSPIATPLRGQALVDEATTALITAVAEGTETADRARALLALEELNPLLLTWPDEPAQVMNHTGPA